MSRINYIILGVATFLISISLYGQSTENCFLDDFELKTAEIPQAGTAEQVIGIDTKSIGVGNKYYIYSFTGGTDNGDFSPNVYINGEGPSSYQWSPYDQLSDIKANSYTIDNEIKFTSPARSVQMIMIEGGNNYVSVNDETNSETTQSYNLY